MTSDDFETLKQKISMPENKNLARLHDTIMVMAGKMVKAEKPLQYIRDVSGKRILHVSREALKRITSCAYAYRMTGDKCYLDAVESNINVACSFPDWNQSHFLDVAEMALAVAIGYDWLYAELSAATKAKVQETFESHAFRHVLDPQKDPVYYKRKNNWNQVCNCGMIAAAISVCERYPEITSQIISEAIMTNREPMAAMYSPDGNYTEGYGYWQYGTLFEVYMLKMLEKSFGTDFGLSEIPGFLKTGDFMLFMEGIQGCYSHSDSGYHLAPSVGMWYFADKLNRADLLYNEFKLIDAGQYTRSSDSRLLALVMCFALNVDLSQVQKPQTTTWSGRGDNPVMLVRKDWTSSDSDAYLAVKGGKATNSHGHMDAGSFVYDAYGVRWSHDLGMQEYAPLEKVFEELGGSLWSMKQKSKRWTIARYNNFHHSTVTVNDAQHVVGGFASLKEHFDDERGKGAVFDMSAVLGKHVKEAERAVVLMEDNSLMVEDKIVSPEDKAVKYSWRMVTKAEPKVRKRGIVLQSGDVKMLLKADSDVKFIYRTWSAEPKESYDEPNPGVIIVGIEAEVPAGTSSDFTVTVSRK